MRLVLGLTTGEAAKKLERTVRHIQWLIKEGRLPAQRVGRDYFIREEDLKLVQGLKRGRPPKIKHKASASKVGKKK